MSGPTMKRKIAVGALLALFCLGVVLTRVIWDGVPGVSTNRMKICVFLASSSAR